MLGSYDASMIFSGLFSQNWGYPKCVLAFSANAIDTLRGPFSYKSACRILDSIHMHFGHCQSRMG